MAAIDRLNGLASETTLGIKAPVLVATTANITLAGVQAIDGVTVGNNSERVLVKNQTDARQNGIYIASSGNWTLARDAGGNTDWAAGTQVFVASGFTNAGSFFYQTTPAPVIIGSSVLSFGPLIQNERDFSQPVTINLTGGTRTNRGPLFVWNDPSSSAAGQNGCAQFWMGNNPTGTPGAGGFVCVTIAAFNGNTRSDVGGLNIVCQQASLGAGWVDGPLTGLEIDMVTAWQPVPNTFSNFGTYKKVGLEVFNDGDPGLGCFNCTSAIAIWARDTTAGSWFYEGLAVSRCKDVGVVFYKDPDTTDGVPAFATAAILDKSASATSYVVTGAHTNGIDLSGGTYSGAAFKSPGYQVDPSGNVLVGLLAANAIGLNQTVAVNASVGTVGFQLQVGAATRVYLAAQTTFGELFTNGAIPLFLGTNNAIAITIGADKSTTLAGKLVALASATGAAGINIPAGTAPTSPNNGDFWFDGSNFKAQVGGATKTFTIS